MQRRLQIIKMRGRAFRAGFHDYVIERGGLRVFPRLVAAEHPASFLRGTISSGNKGLDDMLCGGLDRGTSVLLVGPAGCGKSTIAIQYASAAAGRGERVALFLFDENVPTLLARARGLGMNLQAAIEADRIAIRQIDPGSVSPGEFVNHVRREIGQGATIVVIDTLNGYLNAMPESRFLELQLHELLTYLDQCGVTTIMVMAQHGLIGAGMTIPVDLSYLADTVLVLRYFEAAGRVRQAIAVLKKRSGRHERTLRELQLSSAGVEIGEPLEQFQAILSGVPTYVGGADPLLKK
jgi:circadian clock protein KaiC